MSESEAVLEANERFYRAFSSADLSAMAEVWADEEADIAVVHPGASVVFGRAEVLDTWQAIFGHDIRVDVACEDALAFVHGDMAIVVCTETVGRYLLTATNIFRKTARGWRMVHHQAGPCEVRHDPPERAKPVIH